jgi:hypothetical protein
MLVLSLVLLAGVVAGYAAVSSPELRGPYATPRPSVVNAPRVTPEAIASLDPAAFDPRFASCGQPLAVQVLPVFVGNTIQVYDQSGQTLIAVIRSSGVACSPVIWGQPPSPIRPAPVSP